MLGPADLSPTETFGPYGITSQAAGQREPGQSPGSDPASVTSFEEDSFELSDDAKNRTQNLLGEESEQEEEDSTKRDESGSETDSEEGNSQQSPNSQQGQGEGGSNNPNELTPEEKDQVRELQQRDQEVRAHEQAHLTAAAGLNVSGPTYSFQTGPDGKQYAIGGEVSIETSKGRTPEETLQKAQQIQAAALAPSDPSPQDLRVAATAAQMAAEAQSELSKPEAEENENGATTGAEASLQSNSDSPFFSSSATGTRVRPDEVAGFYQTYGGAA